MKPSRSSSNNSTWLSGLALYFWPKVQLVRQTELAECGLACMAMIASYYGLLMDLSHLRKIYPIGPQGMHMGNLLGLATKLGLQGRAVKLEADELANLQLPAILHWNMNHFVVLSKVKRGRALLYDPALGRHWVRFKELERQFTGVALELEPSSQFQRGERRHEIQLRTMLGRVQGLWPNLSHIFLLSLALEVLVLSSPLITQWVVDEVMVSFDKDLLLLVVMAGVAIGVSELLCTTVRTWVITHFATRLATAWQQRIMQHLLRLKLDFFEKRHVGDILSRLGSAQSIQKLLTTDIVEAILDGITGIITLCLMLTYSVKLTLIALGAVVIFAALRAIRYQPVRQIQESIIVSDAELESHTLETLRGMQAVKLFQLEHTRLQEWLRRLVLNTNHDLNMVKTNMAFHAAERLLGVTETALILWLGANLVLAGEFSVGAYLAFGAWKAQFVSRMDALVNKAVQIGFVRLYAERLADIVYSPLDSDDTAAESAIAADPSAGLVVENIAYRYAVNTNWVFQGVSLHIQLGEFVAISGASGRGKSTLLKVLLGLLDAQQGEIKWQGTPLHQWGSAYRPQIAAVMQDDSLFAGTLADNISLFDVPVDGQKMMECAQIACIHDEIVAMTMGYQTLVGDMGSTLSGGQKQRVLLARALYRKPQLLVLDEATSSLDTELERRINKNIQALKITRIAVAHRPHTLELADRVICL